MAIFTTLLGVAIFFLNVFWPLIGLALLFTLAERTQGFYRWLMLFLGPLLWVGIVFLMSSTRGKIPSSDLFFSLRLGVLFLVLSVYYPILTISGIIKLVKRKKREES